MRSRFRAYFIPAVIAACLGAEPWLGHALGGDLNPPTGPVAPTMKPLNEVEPRVAVNSLPGDALAVHVISAPGSYYLTADVLGAPGKRGIDVRASGVTIDLRGFTLRGVPASLDGVYADAARTSIEVRDGAATGWGNAGIGLFGAERSVVRRVQASDNVGPGIVGGNRSRLEDCEAFDNEGGGILAGDACVFEGCIVSGNNLDGFYSLEGSVWTGCVAVNNGGSGYYLDGDACLINNCTAFGNSLHGVVAIYVATVTDCIATGNGRSGVYAGQGGVVRGCTLSRNTLHGLFAPARTSVESCRFEANGQAGVLAQQDSSVRDCDSVDNAGDGLLLGSRSAAVGNLCAGNGLLNGGPSAGIRATGTDCRIEGNTLIGNARGVAADGAGCLVVRNAATAAPGQSATTNFVLGAAVSFGPIVDVSAGGDLSGVAGASHPLANFSQ